jgi:polar amino acid transport system substrate-binding protein
MMAVPASADALKDEIAPTGKLRVAIAISTAGGAFWSTKNEAGGYAGVPVDLGKEMAAQLAVPVEYVAYDNSGQITDAAAKGIWDVTFLPQDAVRMTKIRADLSGHGCDLHRQGGLVGDEFSDARSARH